MAAPPKYVQRIARLPEVFEALAAHPAGLPLADLAKLFEVSADELHEDLLAFYTADIGPLMLGLTRPAVLDFLGGDDDEPTTAVVVRIINEQPGEELGVEYLDPAELALVATSAQALLEIEPGNKALAGAVEVLTETLFGTPSTPARPVPWNEPLEPLQQAVAERREVRLTYSRSWDEGVFTKVIHPYLLVRTQRGWEVDAGPPDVHGRLRTYLLSNVRSFEALPSTFETPEELPARLAAQRTTQRVRVRIPHSARWAADFYAEDVAVVADDELTATLDLDLLPPVDTRVGLLLMIAGDESWVLDPAYLATSAPILATELLVHHLREG